MGSAIVAVMANYLAMGDESAVAFLDKVAEAKEIINELSGIAQTDETSQAINKVYEALDELLSPICPKCNSRAKRFITSAAQLYDPGMAELPGGTTPYWTGEWYCPKCHHLIAVGKRWWG